MRAGLGENVIVQDTETEVKGEVHTGVGWSGPHQTLPGLHQEDGAKGAVIKTKNKH